MLSKAIADPGTTMTPEELEQHLNSLKAMFIKKQSMIIEISMPVAIIKEEIKDEVSS